TGGFWTASAEEAVGGVGATAPMWFVTTCAGAAVFSAEPDGCLAAGAEMAMDKAASNTIVGMVFIDSSHGNGSCSFAPLGARSCRQPRKHIAVAAARRGRGTVVVVVRASRRLGAARRERKRALEIERQSRYIRRSGGEIPGRLVGRLRPGTLRVRRLGGS